MNRRKKAIIVFLALTLFILLVRVVSTRIVAQVPIVVAKTKIQAREKIKKEDLEEIKIPRKLVKDYFVTNKKDLVGKYVALNHTQYPGMPFHRKSVEAIELAHDKAFLKLNEGEQVFSMKVGVVETFGNILSEGHRVNLHLQYNKSLENRLLAENVRILGVKDRYGKDIVAGENQAHLVLLAIDETYIETLLKAQSLGEISMTLTQGVNNETIYHEGVAFDDL